MREIRWAARLIPITVGVLVTAASVLAWIGRVEKVVEAPGEVRVRGFEVVRAPVEGVVASVAIEPGATVRIGQRLLLLENHQLESDLEAARTDLAQTRGSLAEARRRRTLLIEETHPSEIEGQRSEIRRQRLQSRRLGARSEELDLALTSAKTNLGRSEDLFSAGLISGAELDDARNLVQAAQLRLRQGGIEAEESEVALAAAEQRLELLLSQHRRVVLELGAEIERFEQEEEQLASQSAELETRAASLEVRAGADGILAGPQSNELLGRRLVSGEEIFTILDDTAVRFVAYVPEEAVVKIRTGQEVTIEISGLPKRQFDTFSGTVEEIELRPHAQTSEGRPAYSVEIRIAQPWVTWEETAFYLRDGMRGTASIRYRPNVRLLRSLFDHLVGNPS